MDKMHSSKKDNSVSIKIDRYKLVSEEFGFIQSIKKFCFISLVFFVSLLCWYMYKKQLQNELFKQIRAGIAGTQFKVFTESGSYSYEKAKENTLEIP